MWRRGITPAPGALIGCSRPDLEPPFGTDLQFLSYCIFRQTSSPHCFRLAACSGKRLLNALGSNSLLSKFAANHTCLPENHSLFLIPLAICQPCDVFARVSFYSPANDGLASKLACSCIPVSGSATSLSHRLTCMFDMGLILIPTNYTSHLPLPSLSNTWVLSRAPINRNLYKSWLTGIHSRPAARCTIPSLVLVFWSDPMVCYLLTPHQHSDPLRLTHRPAYKFKACRLQNSTSTVLML